ncbi:hypothetical protein BKA70DRAFT_1258841 [Coprinopsis sp. MPI-PUGE-AT-0042]|nr:hypothetical protein BKA70DRAFT_1258841 [Coprinopsis sp. MPI-PUGE-AT-0042]
MQSHEFSVKVAENFDQGIEDIEYEQYDDNEQVDQLEKSEHNQDQSHWSSDLPDPENYPSSSSLPSSPLPNIFTSSPASSPSWPAQYSSTPPDAELDGDDAGEKFEMLPPSLLEARQREEGSWAYEDADTHHPGGQSRVVEVYMPLLADEEDTDQLQDDAPFPAEDGSHNTPQAMLDALPPSTYPSGWSTEHLSDHSVAKKDVCKGEVPGISVTETHHKGLSMTDNYASTPAAEGLITHALPPPASKDDHDSEDERASSQQGAALASKPVFASLCGEGGRCDRIGSVGNDGATSHANPHARGCVAKEAQAVGIQEIKTSCIEANDEVHGSDIPDYPREVSQSFGSNDTGDSLNDEDVSLDTSGKVPMDEGGVSKPTRGSLAALDTASHREHQSDAELKYKIPEAPEEVHLVSAPGGPKPRRAVRPKVQLIPNPRRPTAAGQKLQEKKLAKPFKCPTITAPAPKPSSIASSSRDAGLRAEPTGFDLPQPRLDTLSKDAKALKEDTKIKHRTVRASAQFKLPLAIAPEQTLVRPTPTVQALERKVQILKRALKVTKENEEEVLEGLIHKWTEAGREIAYEVWTLVKDTTQNDDNDRRNGGISGKRKVEDGWGWDEGPDSKKAKESWGWDASSSDSEPVEGYGNEYETSADSGDTEEDMEEVKHDTIGTMLAQLGICPDTLGWNEEEGCFV